MERNRAYRRHQRRRVIQRKLYITTVARGWNEEQKLIQQPGRLSKAKTHCSCAMCKYEKHYKVLKKQYRAKLDGVEKEIDYLRADD